MENQSNQDLSVNTLLEGQITQATNQTPKPVLQKFKLTILIFSICSYFLLPYLFIFFFFMLAFNDTGQSIISVFFVFIKIIAIYLFPFILMLIVPALFIDLKMRESGLIKKIAVFIALGFITLYVVFKILGIE